MHVIAIKTECYIFCNTKLTSQYMLHFNIWAPFNLTSGQLEPRENLHNSIQWRSEQCFQKKWSGWPSCYICWLRKWEAYRQPSRYQHWNMYQQTAYRETTTGNTRASNSRYKQQGDELNCREILWNVQWALVSILENLNQIFEWQWNCFIAEMNKTL